MNGHGPELLMGKYPLIKKASSETPNIRFHFAWIINPRKKLLFGEYLPFNQVWFCPLKINIFPRASILFRDKGCEKHLLDKFAKEEGKSIFLLFCTEVVLCLFSCLHSQDGDIKFFVFSYVMSLFPLFGFVQINLFVSMSSKQSSLFFWVTAKNPIVRLIDWLIAVRPDSSFFHTGNTTPLVARGFLSLWASLSTTPKRISSLRSEGFRVRNKSGNIFQIK